MMHNINYVERSIKSNSMCFSVEGDVEAKNFLETSLTMNVKYIKAEIICKDKQYFWILTSTDKDFSKPGFYGGETFFNVSPRDKCIIACVSTKIPFLKFLADNKFKIVDNKCKAKLVRQIGKKDYVYDGSELYHVQLADNKKKFIMTAKGINGKTCCFNVEDKKKLVGHGLALTKKNEDFNKRQIFVTEVPGIASNDSINSLHLLGIFNIERST